MPAWYDITSLDDRRKQECEGIDESRQDGYFHIGLHSFLPEVLKLIDEEIKSGTPSDKIVLGGFSQGRSF